MKCIERWKPVVLDPMSNAEAEGLGSAVARLGNTFRKHAVRTDRRQPILAKSAALTCRKSGEVIVAQLKFGLQRFHKRFRGRIRRSALPCGDGWVDERHGQRSAGEHHNDHASDQRVKVSLHGTGPVFDWALSARDPMTSSEDHRTVSACVKNSVRGLRG
jgi:hypothetical protein